MTGDVPVHTLLPLEHYQALYALGRKNGLSVEALVRECVRRQLPNVAPGAVRKRPPAPRVGTRYGHGREALRSPVTDADRETFRKLYSEGMSLSAIGRHLGRVRSTIHKMRDDLGLTPGLGA